MATELSYTQEPVQNDGNSHVCWLVRHGERADADNRMKEFKKSEWLQNNPHRYPLDVPLTEVGREQARRSARTFLQKHPEHDLDIIYASPLHRALCTAVEFAKILELPLCIVPGLAVCSWWCETRGPIVENSNGEWILQNDTEYHNVFLTRDEIVELCEDLEVSFHDSNVDYMETMNILIPNNPRCMCVLHREGIRDMINEDRRLGYCHIEQLNYTFHNDVKTIFGGKTNMMEYKTVFAGFNKNKM